MEPVALLRRTAIGLFGTALSTALLVVAAHGSELPASGDASGFIIHDSEETLRDYCVEDDGILWLVLPGGARYELVTSTADPAIANPGDGSFHPFDEAEVRAALAAERYPMSGVCADVFLLPYPRRIGLDSAAGPKLILLSPGVRPLTVEHQHAEFIHELGHVVQYVRMPDGDGHVWTQYREMRGISDESIYRASAAHADRPHEIFAEDFRSLFGGALANYSGSIENTSLTVPANIRGLSDFIRELSGTADLWAGRPLTAFPNPSIDAVSFARGGGTAVSLELYDIAGRRVATLQPTTVSSDVTWRWDGRDLGGAPAGAGVFFARTRDGHGTLRLTRVR